MSTRTTRWFIVHWAPEVLFAGLAIALIVPPTFGPQPFAMLALVSLLHALRLLVRRLKPASTTFSDLSVLIYLFLLAWHVATAHHHWLDPVFFPPLETLLRLFYHELPSMVQGSAGSLLKLTAGYVLAVILGVSIGVLFGANKRLYHAAVPLAKAIGPIPPIIYIPYAICFFPGLTTAQIVVIFIGAFWPIFLSTLHGIQIIPQGQLDVARTLNLTGHTLRWRILLPGALPSICSGATLGLIFSFILLTAAELIGSASGAGWYVKNYADYGDFARVIVGVAFIGILVLAVTSITDRIERKLLTWLS